MQDFAVFEDSKIVQDDDKFLVVKAVIASEIVHKYKDGLAYKPADELEKAAWTAEGRWVKALSHPASDHIRNVNDINGRMENPRFRKDLNDPKTNRPCRRGIEVDIRFFKRPPRRNSIHIRKPKHAKTRPTLSTPPLRLTPKLPSLLSQPQKIRPLARIQPRPNHPRRKTPRRYPGSYKSSKPLRIFKRLLSRTARQRPQTFCRKQLHKSRQNLLPRKRHRRQTLRTPISKSRL